MFTSSPFVGASSPSKIPLAAKNASVLETTKAALLERPEPGGMVPVTRMSTGAGTGDVDDGEKKKWLRTPYACELASRNVQIKMGSEVNAVDDRGDGA